MIATETRLADRYVLGEVLGLGGMAAVYRATDERLDREVAVKVLPVAEGALGDRLRQEAMVLARLDHPSLVRVLDADEHDGQPFFVMDLVEGETLKQRLERAPLEEPEARQMAREVADGLVHAHSLGVVHRDLKPANIVLGDDGRARVVDFGIARLVDVTGLTKPGTTVGTAAYLAPEQLDTHTDVGPAADVYTFGLVLLESLTGDRPFHGAPVETALARLDRAPEIPSDLPAPWPDLLRRMTALAPDDRPTADVMLQELEQDAPVDVDPTMAEPLAGDPGAATASLRQAPVPATVDVPPVDAAPARRQPPALPTPLHQRLVERARVHRRPLAAVLGLLLVVLIAVAIASAGDDGGRDEEGPRSSLPETIPADLADSLERLRTAVEP